MVNFTTASARLGPPPAISAGWSEHFDAWSSARGLAGPAAHECLLAAQRKLPTNTQSDWLWFVDALDDSRRKLYVAMVFRRAPVPKRLLDAFLRAAVLERNPSLNRVFIEPCVRSWGGGEVNRRLLRYLEQGTNAEKTGAASAFYWAVENPRNEDLVQLRSSILSALLREFVGNEDVTVRQGILPLLRLDEGGYPAEERPLVAAAISIARSHADDYIRHRVEIQVGRSGGPFIALPAVDHR